MLPVTDKLRIAYRTDSLIISCVKPSVICLIAIWNLSIAGATGPLDKIPVLLAILLKMVGRDVLNAFCFTMIVYLGPVLMKVGDESGTLQLSPQVWSLGSTA